MATGAELELGVFATLLVFGFASVILIAKWKIFAIIGAIIFFALAAFMVADYDVVQTKVIASHNATNNEVVRAANGTVLTNSTALTLIPERTERDLVIDSTQSGIGYIFLGVGVILFIAYFGLVLANK